MRRVRGMQLGWWWCGGGGRSTVPRGDFFTDPVRHILRRIVHGRPQPDGIPFRF